jgi:hypothetical protein
MALLDSDARLDGDDAARPGGIGDLWAGYRNLNSVCRIQFLKGAQSLSVVRQPLKFE